LQNGLNIVLNGQEVIPVTVKLLTSDEIIPAYFPRTIKTDEGNISVEIYVGIADREPSDAGWYIFCNKRLVLHANKEQTTGWGLRREVPQYHNDYAAFRGFVYFEAEKAKLLPWNTTKTGIDTDSAIFKAVLLDMMSAMEPVIGFLRDLVKERRRVGDDGRLQVAVQKAKPTPIVTLNAEAKIFTAPTLVIEPDNPDLVTITYKMQRGKVERVIRQMGVSSNREVGKQTFEYYYMMECED